jgi:hypothetical protein
MTQISRLSFIRFCSSSMLAAASFTRVKSLLLSSAVTETITHTAEATPALKVNIPRAVRVR